MPAMRSREAVRSAAFISTLLLTTAFTAPAFAQIETVIVTAEKKAEDLQTVPIAVTSISGDELKQKNIYNFKDLQYNVPNVTYQKGSLGSGAVTIRGIGQAAGDPGISQYQDGIFSEDNDLATADYFDLANIEVLRGPQGTLYGRASVGGLITVNSNHPDLDAFSANGDFTYGEYNTIKGTGVVNIPITDTLGVRLAGQYSGHDGFIKNLAPGTQNPDSQNIYSGRASVRWQPTSTTTIDVVANYDNEADSRDRIDGIECHTDPTGVIGCLPDKLAFQPINSLGNAIGILDSKQWMGTIGQGVGVSTAGAYGVNILSSPITSGAMPGAVVAGLGAAIGGLNAYGNLSPAAYAAATAALGTGTYSPANDTAIFLALVGGYGKAGSKAGIFDLSQVAGSLGTGTSPSILAAMPQKLGVVNNANNSQFDEIHSSYALHLNQKLGSWLTADALVGYSATSRHSQGPYSYFPTEQYNDSYYANSFTAGSANNPITGLSQFAALAGNPAGRVANMIADYFPNYGTPGAAQLFPLSNFNPGGIALLPGTAGSTGGGIAKFVTGNSAADLETFHGRETSTELRFTSNLDGPFNFTTGLFYYDRRNYNEPYQVTFNGGDYFGIFMGAAYGALFPSSNLNPVVAVDPYYYQGLTTTSSSKAVYFDFTYDIIPDDLQFKGGLRWQEDADQLIQDHLSFTGLNSPSGCGSAFCFLQASTSASAILTPAAALEATGTTTNPIHTDRINGRAVLQWSPKLDFTDQSMFYASYSVGSKAGNVNLVSGVAAAEGVPTSFKPEDLTSYEIGAKNTFLDGTLQANLTGWYYDYKNFQYTVVQYSTLFTQNFNAHMWGEEGEFIWQPDEHWQFNLNVTNSDSSLNGGQFAADARNPTAGLTNAVLIKDDSLSATDFPGGNCVLMTASGIDPANDPNVTTFYALQGQTNPFISPFGTEAGATSLRNPNPANNIQFANFGSCSTPLTALNTYLAAHGEPANAYQYASPSTSPGSSISGIAVPLAGRKVLNLPTNTVSVGGQYTFLVDNYKVVPRVDYYWQNGYFSRIFNDPTDAVPSWDQLNLQLQVTAPDDQWYARVFATNVVGNRNVIGLSPQSDTSGVPTYVSTLDPRIIGVTLGAKW